MYSDDTQILYVFRVRAVSSNAIKYQVAMYVEIDSKFTLKCLLKNFSNSMQLLDTTGTKYLRLFKFICTILLNETIR